MFKKHPEIKTMTMSLFFEFISMGKINGMENILDSFELESKENQKKALDLILFYMDDYNADFILKTKQRFNHITSFPSYVLDFEEDDKKYQKLKDTALLMSYIKNDSIMKLLFQDDNLEEQKYAKLKECLENDKMFVAAFCGYFYHIPVYYVISEK